MMRVPMETARLLVLGLSEPTLTMIFDNLASAGRFPRIHVVDNLRRTDLRPFEDPRFPLTRSDVWAHPGGRADAFLGVNKPLSKVAVARLAAGRGLSFTTIVHASASLSHMARLAPGVLVNSLVSIAAFAELGEFVSVNRNASIGHHTRLDAFCTVNPGAHIAGHVRVGARTLIGIGATVVDGVTIGADTIIGAGSVVTKDLPAGVVAHGAPCRVVRELVAGTS
jgi:sugar O-acyltransferase (sialic acid O-acetyltransferase NeuD family)